MLKTHKPYPRAPLVLSLAQVRFAPVTKMAQFVPDIQEILRKNRFPHYEVQRMQQIVFGSAAPEMNSKTRWVFASPHRDHAVILTEDFIVYETSKYESFENFSEQMTTILAVVKEKADLALATRVGLRAVDYIRGLDGKDASDLINPRMRGLEIPNLKYQKIAMFFLFTAQTDTGQLKVQVFLPEKDHYLPPDLESTDLKYDINTEPGSIVLDFDLSAEVNGAFESQSLKSQLSEMHADMRQAFHAAVTPEALALFQKPIEGGLQ